MRNQQNKTGLKPLETLRKQINKIDDNLISLLEERMKVVSKVSELKKNNQEKFFIRSAREADMIKNLLTKISGDLSKTMIVNIWRKIITAANMHEQPLSIAIHNPQNLADYTYLVKAYYSDEVPITVFDMATKVILELEKNPAQIGIFALPNPHQQDLNENWWINLANNRNGLKIFAKIPFVEFSNQKDQTRLVAIAAKNPEKSQSDNSLIYVELATKFSKSQLLSTIKSCGIEAKILKSVKPTEVDEMVFYLCELEGFFDENDEKILALKNSEIKPYFKIIGHYATSIQL